MLEAVDDELLDDVELLPLSSPPRRDLLETTLEAAAGVETADDGDTPLLSSKSDLLVLLVPFVGV